MSSQSQMYKSIGVLKEHIFKQDFLFVTLSFGYIDLDWLI